MRRMRVDGILCIRAALDGHKEIAELLITKGADVNAKDDMDTLLCIMRLLLLTVARKSSNYSSLRVRM